MANRPALAFSYHMPPRNSPGYFAMGLLDQLLVLGDDSLLLGNMFNYDGPMLWTASLFHSELGKKHGFTGDVSGGINELGQLHFVDSQGLDRFYLPTYVRNVMEVKPRDVQSVAETYMVPSKMTIVVVGDKAKIADQLKPFEAANERK